MNPMQCSPPKKLFWSCFVSYTIRFDSIRFDSIQCCLQCLLFVLVLRFDSFRFVSSRLDSIRIVSVRFDSTRFGSLDATTVAPLVDSKEEQGNTLSSYGTV